MDKTPKKPVVLIILDGWGIGPNDDSNAIHLAETPNFDSYKKSYSYTELQASAKFVGLPKDQDGNSEAGHMNIGAGRVVEQDSVIISRAISDGTFFKNPAFLQAIKHTEKNKSNIHLMGMLSDGQSAHSHPDHIISLITLFDHYKIKKIFLHLFTDGRDGPRYNAIKLLRKYHEAFSATCKIASIAGRAYAMDRKKDWKNTKLAYDMMVNGKAKYTNSSAEDAVLRAYNRGETDEFIQPTVLIKNKAPIGQISDKDAVVFFNLRSDRARQLTKPFVQINFEQLNKAAFKRKKVLKDVFFVAMTDFGPDLDNVLTAYPSRDIVQTLPLAMNKYRQLYIAESEKYAHMTYFFNGGYDSAIAGENRVAVPSPGVLSYIRNPKMSLNGVMKRVVRALRDDTHDFIAMNISNADMLAHTGSLPATISAVEFIDENLDKIIPLVLEKGGMVFITADHGNAEDLVNRKTGEIDTEHSKGKVPFLIIKKGQKVKLRRKGILADVAPTILSLLKIKQPSLMTGTSLIQK